ncbi:IS1182 family transposase [Clostridium sp. MCC353]|uniref:IS1182 family transposase n=1 Tax=Clostridium sp. MCC353 TaxID=2592646 RepID=UPI001C01AB9B|nr:IS1182 family transposase [Clostridium sp. MCC353]MBT9774931.1 IS1182 family transposase [Clostridium sp. MCC353]
MFLGDLYRTYCREGQENEPTPRQMLKIIIYAYMNQIYSSRQIETACRRDINFMWLLSGKKIPDHATIARFRSLHFAPCAERIIAEVSEFLYQMGELSGTVIFIDGTKIEACANKYTFVWKKAVSRNMENLLSKLAVFVEECENLYGLKLVHHKQVKMKHIKKLYAVRESEEIVFVHGTGKRKSQLQKSIERLEAYLDKLKEYTQKRHICGTRNSYSKTDHDATFMRMKEDAMKNGQWKAGYNVQHGVDSEYIVWVTVGPEPTDPNTLIPFIKGMEENLRFKYEKIVTDAGYESEENYSYLEKNGQMAFIKPSNYEISKSGKYQKDIGRMENMKYEEVQDTYTCRNGKKLQLSHVKKERTKTGYEREISVYNSQECEGCPYKKECIKGNHSKKPLEERSKTLYVSKKFVEYRKEDLKRITSEEGCELRMNRSIQAEGTFGDIKQASGFRRFLCRGRKNVKAEAILLALAHNMRKLHHKIQSERTGTHLFSMKKCA